jgi:co-chaperonin GroES (HSP10)
MADTDFILKPLGDKIVVRPEKRILSSVILVENKEYDNMGTVVAVGPGKKVNGRREAMPVEVGQYVRFGTMSDNPKDEYLKYQEYFTNNERYLIMSWQDVCFVQDKGQSNGN